jgi:hypothetical protein
MMAQSGKRRRLIGARVAATYTAALAFAWAQAASAAGQSIEAEPAGARKTRVDGLLREWGPLTDFNQSLSGAGKTKVAGMVAYDEERLYVALKVSDKALDRTAGYGPKEDHAALYLAFPEGRGFVTHEVLLYPGQPGKSAAAVRRKGSAVPGAKIVEAPVEGGFTLEASIPWAAFPQAARTRVGLRAALRYTDADGGEVSAVVATSSATSGAALPAMPLEAEQGLNIALVRDKNLPARSARELYGDVAGDGALERVAVYGGYLTITGHRYREGKQFYFAELGIRDASMLTKLELRDADGDGKSDLIVQKRVGAPDQYREIIQVLKVGKDEVPAPLFTHEVAIKTPGGSIENQVQLAAGARGLKISVRQGESSGFDPGTYDELKPSNMEPALLPWESVASRTYEWRGSGFEKVDEARQEPKSTARQAAKPTKRRSAAADASGATDAPPPPRPPTADEMLDRVYALYKNERGVGESKPRFDFVTDVAGDRSPERVLIHDKDIVTFGKGFRQGTSYTFITVGVADSKDILDVTARDLTGDGKAEIIVRAVLHAKASKELGGDVVDRHALLIYSVLDAGLARVFGAETGRSLGKNRIVGAVALQPSERGVAIELRPGRAVGWTEKTYPFPPDTTTAGGLEPLLLPWSEGAARRYRFAGNAFAQ